MKSENAQFYLSKASIPHYELPTMTGGTTIGIELADAIRAVGIAEQEVEKCYENIVADLTMAQIKNVRELSQNFDKILDDAKHRHAEELKELAKSHISDIRELSRKFDEALDERIEAERKKAEDAFCYLCFDRCTVEARCAKFKYFIEKLNAN